MATGISAIIMWTDKLAAVAQFYEALGLQFEKEQHDAHDHVHYVCQLGTTHLAIHETTSVGASTPRQTSGCTQIGIVCDDVDERFKAAKPFSTGCVWEPRDMPWGRAALLCDPDGRAVELNEAHS